MPRNKNNGGVADQSWERLARELTEASSMVGLLKPEKLKRVRGLAFLVEDLNEARVKKVLEKVDLVVPMSRECSKTLMVLRDIVRENRMLRELSVTDTLTGLYNRRFFLDRLQVEMERVRRTEKPCALIMIDLDGFKQVNDTQGHQAGDELLQRVGELIKTSVRAVDLPVRYGGDEFAVILPEAGAQAALKMAERIRNRFLEDQLVSAAGVTGSFGLASYYHYQFESLEELVERADKALYHSKSRGGNQTYFFEKDLEKPTEVTTSERDDLYFSFLDD